MSKKLAALVDVKSLVTLTFTLVFAVLSILGKVQPSDFLTVFLIIITYYFNKDQNKSSGSQVDKTENL